MGDSITIQHVFELVLRLKQICNFDPVDRRQQQARTARSRPGRSRRQRQEGDRLQPVGRSTLDMLEAAARSASARWNITARSRRSSATASSSSSRKIPSKHVHPDELRRRQRRAQPAVLRVRVPVRPLVEPGRRRPGDQPRPPHRRQRARSRSRGCSRRHDRRADQRGARAQTRALRHRSSATTPHPPAPASPKPKSSASSTSARPKQARGYHHHGRQSLPPWRSSASPSVGLETTKANRAASCSARSPAGQASPCPTHESR